MNFIERWLHISPDSGNGSLELFYTAILIFSIILVVAKWTSLLDCMLIDTNGKSGETTRKRLYLVVASMAALLYGCDATTPTSVPTLNSGAQPYVYGTHISETMTDRCSSDVIISLHYSSDDVFDPNQVDGLMLIRAPGGNAYTEWSDQMPVHGHTWIRWFCHSTTGNIFDPGTWRIHGATIGTNCTGDWDQGQVDECQPTGSIDLGSSAVGGWTPERSRCDSENTKAISARLGPDRLLEMRCLE